MLYIGIDAGGREEGPHSGTGVAVLCTDSGVLKICEAMQVNWDEWAMGSELQYLEAAYDPDVVVYESFQPRWGQKFELDTVYLNGAIRAVIEPKLLMPVSPSAHKSIVKRDWAKELVLGAGYFVEQGHKVDALSLCLYAGIKKRDQTIINAMREWNNK